MLLLQRLFRPVVLVAWFCLGMSACRGQQPHNVAEQYLFLSANQERAAHGVAPLRWDETLYRAACRHAEEMAARETIAHQYVGEPELAARAQATGAHFSVVAENVAEAPTAVLIHQGWMASEHHRDNLLDPRLDRIAIRVLMRNHELYAVEDFDRAVLHLSFSEQEQTVARLLGDASALEVGTASDQARQTCELDTGYAMGPRPWFVMRFTTASLEALPQELLRKIGTGRYRQAQVGACPLRESGSFAGYNIAVLLFP